jgi:U3 small nucleolar RNA-associated protein 10
VLGSIDAQVRAIKNADPASVTALLDFIPQIISLIQGSKDVMLRHSAISCIDQISERFGKKDTSNVIAAAQVISGDDGLRNSEDRLKIVSMLCLATMVDVLQDDFIPILPQVLPQTFGYLRSSTIDTSSTTRGSIANAAYALVNAVAEHLAFIFTGDYLDTALQLTQACAEAKICGVNRRQFYRLVGGNVASSEMFSAFNRNYAKDLQIEGFEVKLNFHHVAHGNSNGSQATAEYFDALKVVVNDQSKSSVVKNSLAIFELLLKVFDHRRLAAIGDPDTYKPTEVDRLESLYNDVAIAVILKLNDATFRPFFVRLIEWVTSLPTKEARGRALRATVLYKFLTALFGRLKVRAQSIKPCKHN